jgi:hypothetical protein
MIGQCEGMLTRSRRTAAPAARAASAAAASATSLPETTISVGALTLAR